MILIVRCGAEGSVEERVAIRQGRGWSIRFFTNTQDEPRNHSIHQRFLSACEGTLDGERTRL